MPVQELQLWGGIECTRNRVGDVFFDQFNRSGHDCRPGDLDLIADLGIKTLRYPALWEWTCQQTADSPNWCFIDRQFSELQRLRIEPIAGFVHHGSGPVNTSLLDPGFISGLTRYSRAFARRYPHVRMYTPVNEPLTTARFSGLYGVWFPHRQDNLSFIRCLLHQIRATVESMQAIREVRPDAALVQTEDLGKTYSSPSLKYQADFDNERRWLTFDLLCGRVDRHHPMAEFCRWAGLPEEELAWFRDHPCPPDVIGINYYVTSERYLDARYWNYSTCQRGSNGRQRYADVEAVRVLRNGIGGAGRVLWEAWERYGLPLAVTEAHLGCTREEQLRWLWEVWQQTEAAKADGVDVRAVTAWSLLGSYDWDSLVTRQTGHYEPGAFDVRGPSPRPTALSGLIRNLTGVSASHGLFKPSSSLSVLQQPGWWHRPERLIVHRPLKQAALTAQSVVAGKLGRHPRATDRFAATGRFPSSPPILILGGRNRVAREIMRACQERGLMHQISSPRIAVDDSNSVREWIDLHQPWAVIDVMRRPDIDQAERDPDRCYREVVQWPLQMASACESAGIPLLVFSSDLVFDGRRATPYSETDHTNPLGVFGRAHEQVESELLERFSKTLIVRAGEVLAPGDRRNTLARCHRALMRGGACPIQEEVLSLTYLPDLIHACLDLLLDQESGMWHLAGQGEQSWLALTRELAARTGHDPDAVRVHRRGCRRLAPRPVYRALSSIKGISLPGAMHSLDRYLHDYLHDCLHDCLHHSA